MQQKVFKTCDLIKEGFYEEHTTEDLLNINNSNSVLEASYFDRIIMTENR